MSEASPVRPTEAPRICYRRWAWFLVVSLVIINCGYVLSWPFVVRWTYVSSSDTIIDPATGQTFHTIAVSSPPWVDTLYAPVWVASYRCELPLVSPALRLYEELADAPCDAWVTAEPFGP